MMMVRTHKSSDFYDALHHIVDMYRDSERSGEVKHEQLFTYEN